MSDRTPAEIAAEASGVEVINQSATQVGGVKVTFTIGRIVKSRPSPHQGGKP